MSIVFPLQPKQWLGRIVSARLVSLLALLTTMMPFEVVSTPALAIPAGASVEAKVKVSNTMSYAPFNFPASTQVGYC
ncbi:MAG: hypothetical protein V7K50_06050 [Nostoc sp.]|uniref:hypothetical protein n=1 Tax=Nostoc sp. TaxID=1180 RepID=UPI002FFA61F4